MASITTQIKLDGGDDIRRVLAQVVDAFAVMTKQVSSALEQIPFEKLQNGARAAGQEMQSAGAGAAQLAGGMNEAARSASAADKSLDGFNATAAKTAPT